MAKPQTPSPDSHTDSEERSIETVLALPSALVNTPSDTSYLGRFTFDTILDREGFARILTIIAREYMFGENGNADRTRRALCAWNSIPRNSVHDANTSTKQKWQYKSCFCEYHNEFPELVDKNGGGWFCRHAHSVADFILSHTETVSKAALRKAELIDTQFDAECRRQTVRYQIPIFDPATKGAWTLRFDDIIADAQEQGELLDKTVTVPDGLLRRIEAVKPKVVPTDVIALLIAFYAANKPEDGDWVVLPASNFDAYYGNCTFSRKWMPRIGEPFIEKKPQSYGISKYRVCKGFWV